MWRFNQLFGAEHPICASVLFLLPCKYIHSFTDLEEWSESHTTNCNFLDCPLVQLNREKLSAHGIGHWTQSSHTLIHPTGASIEEKPPAHGIGHWTGRIMTWYATHGFQWCWSKLVAAYAYKTLNVQTDTFSIMVPLRFFGQPPGREDCIVMILPTGPGRL